MSSYSHSRRFDPRWLLPAFGRDGADLFGVLDASPPTAEESTNVPTGQDFDEALEQIASERRCVCPLCGAIVGSDGAVLS